MQYNKVTGLEYQGRNQGKLTAEKGNKGFTSDAWVTFLQAKALGLKVKKGSKGIHIFKGFLDFTEINKKTGKAETVSRPVGFATVFNLDQTEKMGGGK
jgi:antirestriction protein ArdC